VAQADAYQLPLNITDNDMMALVEQAGELFVPLAGVEVADDKDGIAAQSPRHTEILGRRFGHRALLILPPIVSHKF
jgi:hypothetical protein